MAEMIKFSWKNEEILLNVANLAYIKMNRDKNTVMLRTMVPNGERHQRFKLTGDDAIDVINQIDNLSN